MHKHEEHCHCHEETHAHAHDHSHAHCHCQEETHEHAHAHEHCHCHDDACHHGHHHDEVGGCAHCAAKLTGENRIPKSVVVRLALTGVLLLVLLFTVPVGEGRAFSSLALSLYLLPYLIIGYDVLWGALKNIARGKLFDEQFLMSIATVGAFFIGEYPEGVAVMLFYQLGELLQTLAVGKSRRSISALMDIRPDSATVLREGREYVIPPQEVAVGEVVLVRPGEKIPLDGTVIFGESVVDQAALTGESLPQPKSCGARVISGSINLDGVIHVSVESSYAQSTVSKIMELVEHSGEKKARIEGFITRFSRYYTPIVVLCALALALIPTLFFSQPFSEWLHRALVFLVVSCPCALVISVPLSFFGGIGAASRQGVLIKGASYLEQLSRVDSVVFDKTGTLTEGRFSIYRVESPVLPEQELLAAAGAVERFSNHPIAACIAAYAKEEVEPSDVQERTGKGVLATWRGACYAVGSAVLMKEQGVDVPAAKEDGSVVYVARDGRYLGYVVVRDTVKPQAKEALQSLKQCGVRRTVMLTGDGNSAAQRVANELEIAQVHAELLPQQKVEIVESMLGETHCVAFVGDGINDAPVLARADVGIAMGGIGSDAAIESADVVLMDDAPQKISVAVRISKKTMRIVRQNITFALVAKVAIMVLGALDVAGLWLAVFGDVGVMLLAILNAMRAMHVKK